MKVGDEFKPFGLFTGLFIPEAIARTSEISLGAKMVYGRLCRYAGEQGDCFPFVATLGAELAIGQRQARRYISELELVGLIRRENRASKIGDPTSNDIKFLWHSLFETDLHVLTPGHICPNPRSDVTAPPTQNCQLTDYDSSVYEAREDAKRVIEESQLNINNRDDAASGEPPRLLTEEEWPLTTARVRQRFFSVDSIFMSRLIHSAVQAVCSCGGVVAELTDENLDWMVLEVLKNPKIYSAGLLLTAIPQGIRNLYKSHLVSGGRK